VPGDAAAGSAREDEVMEACHDVFVLKQTTLLLWKGGRP
jgi:hypothetical protein